MDLWEVCLQSCISVTFRYVITSLFRLPTQEPIAPVCYVFREEIRSSLSCLSCRVSEEFSLALGIFFTSSSCCQSHSRFCRAKRPKETSCQTFLTSEIGVKQNWFRALHECTASRLDFQSVSSVGRIMSHGGTIGARGDVMRPN